MISDDIPAERPAADEDIVGPSFLWRLLIDRRFRGRGDGAATLDAVAAHVAANPNEAELLTSCAARDGSPQPFDRRDGFAKTGEVEWGEELLRLDLAPWRNGGVV